MTGRLGSRAAWSLVDQVLVSLRNFLLLLVIIRTTSPATVGAFGIVYTTYFLAMALVRGFGGDTLVVRASGTTGAEYADSVRGSSAAVLVLSGASGVVLALVALPFGGVVRTGLLVLALLLIPLLLQDHFRLALFAGLRPRTAAANDALVLALQVVGTLALIAVHRTTLSATMLVWGTAGAVGALWGLRQLRTRVELVGARKWVRTHRDLGPAFATDAMANRGAEQLANIGIGVLSTLSAVGALTAARTLYAPLTTIQTGVNTFLMPEVARRSRASGQGSVAPLVAIMSLALGAVMFLMGFLLWVMPTQWGEFIFSENWNLARPVLVPMAAFSAVNAVSFGYWAGLKALGRGRTVLIVRGAGGAALVLAACLGAVVGDAVGAAWGMTTTTALTAGWLANAFHRAAQGMDPSQSTTM